MSLAHDGFFRGDGTAVNAEGRPPPHYRKLSEAERTIVLDELARRSGASDAQIGKVLSLRFGRRISRHTVQSIRHRGGWHDSTRLTDAERDLLRMLIVESWDDASAREIAEAFAGLAGRTIHLSLVWRVAVLEMGLPRKGAGRGHRRARAKVESDLVDASARKLARSKVDRSIRVGRSGRVVFPDEGESS